METPVMRAIALCILIVYLSGCATYGEIDNAPLTEGKAAASYSFDTLNERVGQLENSFLLAFSGGGTRAAAFSYGVLKALRDIRVETSEGEKRLLDAVDTISSVSGGSFTSAYYGLNGDRIFVDYESDFLRKDVQGHLLNRLFNPFNWFRIAHRTDWAVDYYDKHVFHGATYADMLRADGPLILVNASDLAGGNGVWFTQEYFDLLCSDIRTFPVSRAVAASSAVPGLFTPVVLQNFSGCQSEVARSVATARASAADRGELRIALKGLENYADKEKRPYIHLVDGGITDNLGIRGFYDFAFVEGGAQNYYRRHGRKPPRRVVLLVVDASAEHNYAMNQSSRIPPLGEVIAAMSNDQLRRYNAATLSLIQRSLDKMSRDLSTPERPVATHLIYISFDQVQDPARKEFLNNIPTSFSLTDDQVDALIEAGGELLRSHPEFRKVMAEFTVKAGDLGPRP